MAIAAVGMLAAACSSGSGKAAPALPPDPVEAAQSVVRIVGFGCGAPALGSGFAIAENLIVTSGHLVTGRDPETLAVARPDGTEANAVLVGFDADFDLAALRVDDLDFDAVVLALDVPITDGFAMAVRSDNTIEPIDFVVDAPVFVNWDGVFRDTESRFHGIRLDADISRGDSGSALFVSESEVIGLVHSTSRRGEPVAYAVSGRQIGEWVATLDTETEVMAPHCT